MKVLVGMSGGVDSCAAAAILKKEHTVSGVTLELFCESKETKTATKNNIKDAKAVAKSLNIDHFTLDLKQDFKTFVTDAFINDYIRGLTPNPCLYCNKFIKFGKMLEFANKNGFDKIATGHYAQIEQKNGKFYLKCALDPKKDQTYVLYGLNQEILSKLLLPLGALKKQDARKIAEQNGLVTAHKSDSQDICFVPDGDYAAFIEAHKGQQKSGDFVDKSGNVLGTHKGIIHYTIGQRKGLGVAFGHPVFVTGKDAQKNLVTLGSEENLFYNEVLITDLNFICDKINSGEKIKAKLRYSQTAADCIFTECESGAILKFSLAQRAPSAGQAAVFYKGGYCLGGGTIVKGVK